MTAWRNRVVVSGVALLNVWAMAAPARAQARDVGVWVEANGGRAKVELRVFVPLLGWIVVPVTQSPIAPTLSSLTGAPVEAAIANVTVPLGVVPVAQVGGVSNRAQAMPPGPVASASATSHVAEATLLNGLVRVQDLVAHVDLAGQSLPGARPAFVVTGTTFIQEITVAGVTLRLGEIPPNTTLPLIGQLVVPILGLRLPIPITATITLNEQRPHSAHGLEVNALRIKGGGQILGLATLDIDILLGGPTAEGVEDVDDPWDPMTCPTPGRYFQIPDSGCRDAITCTAERSIAIRCPSGLRFDEGRQTCDWARNVACP